MWRTLAVQNPIEFWTEELKSGVTHWGDRANFDSAG